MKINHLKPDWFFAEKHAKAARPGRHNIINHEVNADNAHLICPCCFNVI